MLERGVVFFNDECFYIVCSQANGAGCYLYLLISAVHITNINLNRGSAAVSIPLNFCSDMQ